MLTDQLLKSLKRRKAGVAGQRIGTASGYLRRLAGALGIEELAKHAGVTASAVKEMFKTQGGVFTFFDADTATPAASWFKGKKTGAKINFQGTPLIKGEDGTKYELTKGSLMDFDCVITTGRRDRDGDVLDPKGAMVDPKMPLLWQHIPVQPIGRMVRLLEQADDKVTGRFMIADTQLGHDAAVLIDAGCLRISHGFAPIEYNPLKDENGKEMGGWKITKYAMMEASAVSIPSNVDAEITANSRGKLHHPLVKSWCKMLETNRPKFFKAGWAPESADPKVAKKAAKQHVHVTIELKGLPGVKADKEDEEEEKGTKGQYICEDCDEVWSGPPGQDCPECGSHRVGDLDQNAADAAAKEEEVEDEDEKAEDEEVEEKDGEEEEEVEDEEEEGDPTDEEVAEKDDGEEEEEAAEGEEEGSAGKSARALGEIIDAVKGMAGDKSLPKEAAGRLAIVQGMFEDIEEGIGASADAIGTAAKSRDIAGMYTAMAELTEACVGKLTRAAEELERVSAVEELPDGVASQISEVVQDAQGIVAAVGALTAAASAADDEQGAEDGTVEEEGAGEENDFGDENETGDEEAEDDGDEMKDDDELEDDEAEAEEEKDDEEEEDADESDEVEEKDEDEDDVEEKGREGWKCNDCGGRFLYDPNDPDYGPPTCIRCGSTNTERRRSAEAEAKDDEVEEEDEKDGDAEDTPRDENPENEADGEENPGVNDGKAKRRRLSELLGRALTGKPLTAAERKRLRANGYED